MSTGETPELPTPMRIYALAINEAERVYRSEVQTANAKRQAAINEAYAACETAMEAMREAQT
jgi:hypothetical protein